MLEDTISIIEIARIHGKRPQSIHKIVKRLGIEASKVRSEDSRGQLISYISKRDYEDILEYLSQPDENDPESVNENIPGVFYLIQLEPEHDPGRYKLGFASNIQERLRSHRTAAPFATVVETWPCKLLWEKTAIDSITATSEKLHTEVFRTSDIQDVRKRCTDFFAQMPKLV